jgi:hypothetical protein
MLLATKLQNKFFLSLFANEKVFNRILNIWAFPFAPLRVGLSAANPRFAAGFPLPSLMQYSHHNQSFAPICISRNFTITFVAVLLKIYLLTFKNFESWHQHQKQVMQKT